MRSETTRLGDLCDLVQVQVDPQSQGTSPYLGLEHLASGRFTPIGGGSATEVESSKYAFERGDVLYGKLRPYLDKAVLADAPGVCTTELLVLRPKEGVDPRFLTCVVHTPGFVEYAVSGTSGAQHPRTSWSHIREFALPSFPTTEQADIAALLWRVNDGLDANERLITAGSDLKRAAMKELFRRGLRGEAQKETEIGLIPESWPVTALGGYVESPDYGYTASASVDPVGPRFLRITDIQDGLVDWKQVPYCACPRELIDAKRLRRDDIVVARIGATTGKAFLLGDCPESVFASYLIRLRTREQLVPRFLYHFMQTDTYWSYINQNKGGRLKGGANVPVLKALPIPVPGRDEQNDILSILDAIDRKIDLHRRKRAVLDDLFKVLLHKLMRGEIRVADLNLEGLGLGSEALA